MGTIHHEDRCGIVLAGATDNRLSPFISYLKGRPVPKAYVNFIGTRSMLQHTCDRAERLVRRECLHIVVTREHLRHPEVQRQVFGRPRDTVIIQPEDRASGPEIILALAHIHNHHPGATVAVFPADHFILEEDLFMTQVAMAFYMVESDPSDIVLLAVEPESPDPGYEYMLADGEVDPLSLSAARNVRLLVDTADEAESHELTASSGLWNTMAMVFQAATAVDLLRRFSPELFSAFAEIENALGSRAERAVVERAYRCLPPLSFSDEVLQRCALSSPAQIRVVPLSGVLWSDWSSAPRIIESLKTTGYIDRLTKTPNHRLQVG
jgi:mannose-1-phosphate guanylyltransferase